MNASGRLLARPRRGGSLLNPCLARHHSIPLLLAPHWRGGRAVLAVAQLLDARGQRLLFDGVLLRQLRQHRLALGRLLLCVLCGRIIHTVLEGALLDLIDLLGADGATAGYGRLTPVGMRALEESVGHLPEHAGARCGHCGLYGWAGAHPHAELAFPRRGGRRRLCLRA